MSYVERFNLRYRPFGSHAILVDWPQEIDENILDDVLLFKSQLEYSSIKHLVEINNAYSSLIISYNRSIDNFYDTISRLRRLYSSDRPSLKRSNRSWKIPVCYDPGIAPDLLAYSKQKNLSIDQIIAWHTAARYRVYFIGFLPGFLYLGGLDQRLHMSRKETPSLHVKKGAVAIGGQQTGIYPQDSPGGWHVIGSTPIEMFNATKKDPCFAIAGDQLHFYAVNLETYHNTRALIDAGVYQMESEGIND